MNFTDNIIVLLRQNFRERDRIVSAYSCEHGRISLRFPGVNRSDSKLKAVSEPFAHSCARIYLRANANIGCVTGGKIETVYPQIRRDFNKTNTAHYFCELFYRLTPEASPNPAKFELLQESLKQINDAPLNQAAPAAFLLRLMQLSGFGLRDISLLDIDENFWRVIHNTPLSGINILTEEDLLNLNKARYICRRFLNKYLTWPLNTMNHLEVTTPAALEEALKETALEPALAAI